MAEAARQRSYDYLGLTDHSQSAHYAGGLKVDAVLAQHHLIDGLNSRYGARFLSSKVSSPTFSRMAHWTIPTTF